MITDRTLLAYEQFCENYYDDFSILSRTTISPYNTPYTPTEHLSPGRKKKLDIAGKANLELPNGHPRKRDLPAFMGGNHIAYTLGWKRLDKLGMKRNPKYREKRLAEIADRKAKNRALQERAKERREKREFNSDVNSLVERLNKTVK